MFESLSGAVGSITVDRTNGNIDQRTESERRDETLIRVYVVEPIRTRNAKNKNVPRALEANETPLKFWIGRDKEPFFNHTRHLGRRYLNATFRNNQTNPTSLFPLSINPFPKS